MLFYVYKGKHRFRPNRFFPFWKRFAIFKNSLNIRVKFTDSCLYELTSNQGQINKLYGYGHTLRIGWTGENGKIVLYWYKGSASTGSFSAQKIQEVEVNKYTSLSIPIEQWYFRVFTWLNFPYFGGKEPAPKTAYLYLEQEAT